jgi:hypothetical protein
MADNVTLNPTTGVSEATVVAFDDCGAAGKVQIIKLAVSADGSATVLPADATNGVYVDVKRLPGTVAADITSVAGKDFATQTTLGAILAKIIAAPATEATLASVLAKLSADPATQTTLAAVLAKLSADPATQTTLAAVLAKLTADPATQTTLAAVAASLAHGTYAYKAGTTATTVDVPAGARVRRVQVRAGATAATVTVAGGDTITVLSGDAWDDQIPGDATLGGDVVIGGGVASYYVAWTV